MASQGDSVADPGSTDAKGGSKRCFVNNLAWRTSWQDLKDHFKPCGAVVYANVTTDNTGRSKGWGIVEFESGEQASVAINTLNGSELGGRFIMVREDREDRELKKTSAQRESSGLQVVIHGLPWSFDDDKLLNLVKDNLPQAGVESATIAIGRDSRSRGYGTVKFETADDVRAAISELDGFDCEGRYLTVKMDQWG